MITSRGNDAADSKRKLITLGAVVTLVLCTTWLLVYLLFFGRAPQAVVPQEFTDFVSKAMPIVQAGPYTGVQFEYDQEGKKIKVFGPIYKASDATKLKAALDAITPRPPLEYDFVIDKNN